MKLLSWNVNGIRASYKKGALQAAFDLKPDLLAIQETKSTPDQLPENKYAPAGYEVYFDSSESRKGYSGVAIYTKHKPLKVERGLGDKEMDHEGRMLTLHFDNFAFVTCYFPNGGRDEDHFQFKLRYYDLFLKKMIALRKKYGKVIFCGDLNVAHNEIDLTRPKENANQIGFLPIERAWVDRVCESGFIDTFRYKNKDTVKYSWWDQKTRARERNVGWRIDYFFVTKEHEKEIKNADILDTIVGSDHAPTLLEVRAGFTEEVKK
jgi:exodeoxyribonuclease-3